MTTKRKPKELAPENLQTALDDLMRLEEIELSIVELTREARSIVEKTAKGMREGPRQRIGGCASFWADRILFFCGKDHVFTPGPIEVEISISESREDIERVLGIDK